MKDPCMEGFKPVAYPGLQGTFQINPAGEVRWRYSVDHAFDGAPRWAAAVERPYMRDGRVRIRLVGPGGREYDGEVDQLIRYTFPELRIRRETPEQRTERVALNAPSADELAPATAHKRGVDHPSAKLDPERVRELRRLSKEGWTVRALAERFDVSTRCVQKVLKGRTWSWVV